jgi:hypothetical protein
MSHVKHCSTPMACSYAHHCQYKHTPLSGSVQFFFPDATGEHCQHYIKYFQPWGEGKDGVEHD